MGGSPGPLWPSMLPVSLQNRDDLCTTAAKGVRVRFADGRELLCGTSGLWNVNLGYGNAAIARAAADALCDASYLGVYQCENAYARRAAAALTELCGPDHYARVMFSTSGGAANDLVMKLVRHYHVLRGDKRRNGIVAMRGCWHGLTYGAFALTSDSLGQRMYGVDRRLVLHVTPNDPGNLSQLLEAHGDRIGAIVVEPVLGTGALPLDDGYVAELIRQRSQHGFLLVADEVATGFGRTGSYFASELWPERPDILITSKGLTNGASAAAAVLVSHQVAEPFGAEGVVLAHGETQAGTPVTCATILATMGEMRRLDAVARGERLGRLLGERLAEMVTDEPLVSATTGAGCFRSLRLSTPDGGPLPASEVGAVITAIREAGALVHAAPDGIQLLPALVYSDAELDELLECVHTGLAAYSRTTRKRPVTA
jgi:adenosylmethionine-8-amino-7-oxononanoate aminotransferase